MPATTFRGAGSVFGGGGFVNVKLMLRPAGCSKHVQKISPGMSALSFWYLFGPPTNLFNILNHENWRSIATNKNTAWVQVRVVGAAVITFDNYCKLPCEEDDFPADDACLLFTTLAIKSCSRPEVCSQVDADIKELVGGDVHDRGGGGIAWHHQEGGMAWHHQGRGGMSRGGGGGHDMTSSRGGGGMSSSSEWACHVIIKGVGGGMHSFPPPHPTRRTSVPE